MPTKYHIVSDLHLGSPYFMVEAFDHFLDRLPEDTVLILNGDVVNRIHAPMPPSHTNLLNRLAEVSHEREIIWLTGNHADYYEPQHPHRIVRAREWTIQKRLLITHGHDFDNVMRHNILALVFFRTLHNLHERIHKTSLHPAEFGKRFHILYRLMCAQMASRAIRAARRRGFAAVTCGHVHRVEDRTVDGVRYINTGSWTESPLCVLTLTDDDLRLHNFDAPGTP